MVAQKIEFNADLITNSQICIILQKSKETFLEIYKKILKVL